jgi:HAD superfamily hydrolase (TIGR01509 family)
MNMPFELVIFDCDGVLVDSEPIAHRVLVDLLAEHGVQLTMQHAYTQFLGQTNEEVGRRVATLLKRTLPTDFLPTFRARLDDALRTDLQPVESVRTVLDNLAIPFCVASNSSHERIRLSLAVTNLLERFESRIFSANDVARPKPAPDLYLHAARTLGANPNKCCVIEDSFNGIRAALAANMTAFGLARLTPVDQLIAAGATATSSSLSSLVNSLHARANETGDSSKRASLPTRHD